MQTVENTHLNGGQRRSVISIDLLRAARRSDTTPENWSDADVTNAAERYEKFLRLVAKHPGRAFAPTRDIDIMWHLHMLNPRAYFEDCQRLVGTILGHDGGFGRDPRELPLLKQTFMETSALWEGEYGESYVQGARGSSRVELHDCWHDCSGRCWHACDNEVRREATA